MKISKATEKVTLWFWAEQCQGKAGQIFIQNERKDPEDYAADLDEWTDSPRGFVEDAIHELYGRKTDPRRAYQRTMARDTLDYFIWQGYEMDRYQIEYLDDNDLWQPVGSEPYAETEEEGEDGIEALRELGPEWADLKYRVRDTWTD